MTTTHEVNDAITDIRVVSAFDIERFAWVVVGCRRVDGERFGVGLIVESENEVTEASEHVRRLLSNEPIQTIYKFEVGTHVRFANLSLRAAIAQFVGVGAL